MKSRSYLGQANADEWAGVSGLWDCLFSSKSFSRFSSTAKTPWCTARCQELQSVVCDSMPKRGMTMELSDVFKLSLKRLLGPPVFLVPDARSRLEIVFVSCLSSIRNICPTHLSRAYMVIASMQDVEERRRIFVYGTKFFHYVA